MERAGKPVGPAAALPAGTNQRRTRTRRSRAARAASRPRAPRGRARARLRRVPDAACASRSAATRAPRQPPHASLAGAGGIEAARQLLLLRRRVLEQQPRDRRRSRSPALRSSATIVGSAAIVWCGPPRRRASARSSPAARGRRRSARSRRSRRRVVLAVDRPQHRQHSLSLQDRLRRLVVRAVGRAEEARMGRAVGADLGRVVDDLRSLVGGGELREVRVVGGVVADRQAEVDLALQLRRELGSWSRRRRT